MIRRVVRALVASAGLIALANPQFTPAITIKTGLDSSTKSFLNHYPVVLREQMILALQQALPLVEQGIDHTFDRVDQSVDHAFSQIDCTLAVIQPTVADTTSSIKAVLLGHGDSQFGSADMTNLDQFAGRMKAKVGASTSPLQVEEYYSNVLGTAYRARCFYAGVGSNTPLVVARISAPFISNITLWIYLDSLQCKTSTDCYRAAFQDTQAYLTSADLRDVAGANAGARFAALSIPDPSFANGFDPHFTGWLARFHRSRFDLDSYEAHIREMVAIQFEVAVKNAERVDQAKKALDRDQVTINVLKPKVDALHEAYVGSSSAKLASAFGDHLAAVKAVQTSLANVDVRPALALSNDPELQKEAVQITDYRDPKLHDLAMMLSGYDDLFNRLIKAEQAEQRRQQAEMYRALHRNDSKHE